MKTYDRLAKVYDQLWQHYITETLSFLKGWACIPTHAAVLDVGCGTGEFERFVLAENRAQTMVGVDPSMKMLEIARRKCAAYPNVTFCRVGASDLPFGNESFDVIVSASAFHYFEQPETALAEMRRVLKPSGSLIILDWCKDYLWCRLIDGALRRIEPEYQQSYTQSAFHELLVSAEFHIQSARRVRFGPLWGLMIAKAVKINA